jgi:hypothetical protein
MMHYKNSSFLRYKYKGHSHKTLLNSKLDAIQEARRSV